VEGEIRILGPSKEVLARLNGQGGSA